MRLIPTDLARLALVATLTLPAASAAQAPSARDGCFAQPRVQADSAAAPGAARGEARDTARASTPRGVDVVLLASVSARELRFQSQPRISVRLCGGFDSVRVVERRNLPERVVPGVTYRDVYVAVEILGHIYADCLRESIVGAGQARCPTGTDTARSAPRRPR